MTITYEYEDALYVNLTNKCNCNCEFCLRHGQKEGSIYTEDSLWLEREPTREEALDRTWANIPRSSSAAMGSPPTAWTISSGW